MTEEELKQRNFELAEQNRVLSETIKNLTTPKGPTHINMEGVNSLVADPRDIASGKIVCDFPEPEAIKVGENEIHRNDTAKIQANLDKIARGEIRVVG
jgi:hypothetical protein